MPSDIDQETIRVVPHDPAWPELFLSETRRILPVLNPFLQQLEHIGSTAVPGLSAKPIVDIAARVESVDYVEQFVAPLAELGYRYLAELVAPRCHYFCRGAPREFSLHVVDDSTDHWIRWITFRDRLRSCPDLCREYEELKRRLVASSDQQRERYTYGKTDFIESVLSNT